MNGFLMRFYALGVAVLFSALRLFAADLPKVVFISGEFEYHSRETFPAFAKDLEKQYKVKTIILERPADEKAQTIAGLENLEKADLVVLMIRRMVLPEDQLKRIKRYLDEGRPLVALRTASHSFENWKEFDAQVLGGNYQNHYGNEFKPNISLVAEQSKNPLLNGVSSFVSDGSLYRNTPLQHGSVPLLQGAIPGKPAEPVAWTHEYRGGRIFYTSLGHPSDFKNDSFRSLLHNAIEWALAHPLERRTPQE